MTATGQSVIAGRGPVVALTATASGRGSSQMPLALRLRRPVGDRPGVGGSLPENAQRRPQALEDPRPRRSGQLRAGNGSGGFWNALADRSEAAGTLPSAGRDSSTHLGWQRCLPPRLKQRPASPSRGISRCASGLAAAASRWTASHGRPGGSASFRGGVTTASEAA